MLQQILNRLRRTEIGVAGAELRERAPSYRWTPVRETVLSPMGASVAGIQTVQFEVFAANGRGIRLSWVNAVRGGSGTDMRAEEPATTSATVTRVMYAVFRIAMIASISGTTLNLVNLDGSAFDANSQLSGGSFVGANGPAHVFLPGYTGSHGRRRITGGTGTSVTLEGSPLSPAPAANQIVWLAQIVAPKTSDVVVPGAVWKNETMVAPIVPTCPGAVQPATLPGIIAAVAIDPGAGVVWDTPVVGAGGSSVDGKFIGQDRTDTSAMALAPLAVMPAIGIAVLRRDAEEGIAIAGDSNQSNGAAARRGRAMGLPVLNLAFAGERGIQASARTGRLEMAAYLGCTKLLIGYGTNDLDGGATAAQIDAALSAMEAWALANGYRSVVRSTLPPITNSTDNWVTVNGQSVRSFEAQRLAYNALVRARSTNFVLDLAALYTAPGSPEVWIAGTSGDGVHPWGDQRVLGASRLVLPPGLVS